MHRKLKMHMPLAWDAWEKVNANKPRSALSDLLQPAVPRSGDAFAHVHATNQSLLLVHLSP